MEPKITALLLWMDISLITLELVEASPTCRFIDTSGKARRYFPYDKIKCEQNNICAKYFNVTYIGIVPYYHHHIVPAHLTGFHDAVHDMLGKCCGKCVRYKSTTINNMEELTRDAINTSDFVFPVFARADTQYLYGFHYLPYHKAPHTYYITKHKDDFLLRIVSIWPVLLISMLMTLIAGFIGWACETWKNETQFPRPFHVGLSEGLWWSFVSMTTVGYGDKAPTSGAGRLFAAVWIIIGIIAFGIVTGDITGQVVKTNSPPPEKMDGKNVGILKFRDYDTYVVSDRGGNIKHNNGTLDFVSDIKGLIRKLMNDEIDGFLLDKYTLWFVTELRTGFFRNAPEMQHFFIKETLFTEQEDLAESLSYGVLIRNTDDYNYFKDFVHDAVLRKSISWTVEWVRVKNFVGGKFYSAEGEITLFDTTSLKFQHTIIVLAATIFVICVTGFFYEFRRRKVLCGGQVGNMEESNGC